MAIAPGALDQDAARTAVSGQRQAAAFDRLASRPFRGYEAQESHQLPRVVEAAYIADFADEGDGNKERDAAKRLIGRDHRCHRPTRHQLGQLSIQPRQPVLRIGDRVDLVLEDDLLDRVIELL
ncbi:hypothetical protein D9M72_578210 [compost metagenome]